MWNWSYKHLVKFSSELIGSWGVPFSEKFIMNSFFIVTNYSSALLHAWSLVVATCEISAYLDAASFPPSI